MPSERCGHYRIIDVEWEDEGAFPGAFMEDVRTCLALGVDQASTYPLMRFGYTPFGTARHDRRREHAVLGQATELASSMGGYGRGQAIIASPV